MQISFYFNTLSFIVLCIFAISWVIQMSYFWGLFSRLAFFKKNKYDNTSPSFEPVSVIVCARDAYEYLVDLVPKILSQDYPEFELVIVNDCSVDETTEYLKELKRAHPEVNIVTLTQSLNFFHGKKFPLSMGIKSARHELLLLTDADCLPQNDQWIKGMVSAYRKNTEVVIGYGPYFKRKGLLNKLIRFDTLYTAIQYLSMALANMPYMGVGRNLSYRKSTFFKNKGFTSHYNIPSGDDDIFISQVANKRNTHLHRPVKQNRVGAKAHLRQLDKAETPPLHNSKHVQTFCERHLRDLAMQQADVLFLLIIINTASSRLRCDRKQLFVSHHLRSFCHNTLRKHGHHLY